MSAGHDDSHHPPPPAAAAEQQQPPKDRAGLCEMTLASGACCRFRARHEHEGYSLCGVHMRQRAAATECAVCLGPVRRRAQADLACGHKFHTKCVRAWFRKRPLTCPLCRAVCLEGLAMLGPRLAPRLLALTRTLPPPPRAFFPAYIVSKLESPEVAAALGVDPGQIGRAHV